MSTLAYASDDQGLQQPKSMPPEVGTVAAAWWLTIGLSALLIAGILPMSPKPLVEAGSITSAGWFGVLIVLGLMLAVGIWIGSGLRNGKPGAEKLCKIGLLGLLVLDLVAITAVIALSAMSKPEGSQAGLEVPLGPVPLLGIVLLAFMVLMPVLFAILSFSLLAVPAVGEYFVPAQEETPVSYGAEEAAGGAWEGGAAPAGLAAGEETHAYEPGAEYAPASDHAPGVEAPADAASDAFDAALAQEMPGSGETVAYEPAAEQVLGEEALPSAAAESSVSEVFAQPLIEEAQQDASATEAMAEALADEIVPAAEAEPDGTDIIVDKPRPGSSGSFVVTGPPRMTESQVEITDIDDAPEGTGLTPVETWDFNQSQDEKDKKQS
jgi:hypothetical protein